MRLLCRICVDCIACVDCDDVYTYTYVDTFLFHYQPSLRSIISIEPEMLSSSTSSKTHP